MTTVPILLGKKDPSPRNRSLFLTEEDLKTFSKLDCLEQMPAAPLSISDFQNRIFNNPCQAGLGLLPAESIDLIIADPPYNNGKDYGVGSLARMSKEDYERWADAWLSQAVRSLKTTGSLYLCCDWESSGLYQRLLEKYLKIKNRITWRREKGRGARRNWKNNLEDIWFAVASEDYIFNLDEVKLRKSVIAPYRDKQGRPKDWVEQNGERYRMTYPSNIWTDITVPFWSMRENTPHPTQKPERLIERLVLASSRPGDVVLDPFLGSGTTAVVARRHRRRYIGFEVNPDYVRLALKRLRLDQSGYDEKSSF